MKKLVLIFFCLITYKGILCFEKQDTSDLSLGVVFAGNMMFNQFLSDDKEKSFISLDGDHGTGIQLMYNNLGMYLAADLNALLLEVNYNEPKFYLEASFLYFSKVEYNIHQGENDFSSRSLYQGKTEDNFSLKSGAAEIGYVLSFENAFFKYLDYTSIKHQKSKQKKLGIGLVFSSEYDYYLIECKHIDVLKNESNLYPNLSTLNEIHIHKIGFDLMPIISWGYTDWGMVYLGFGGSYDIYVGEFLTDSKKYDNIQSSLYPGGGVLGNTFFIDKIYLNLEFGLETDIHEYELIDDTTFRLYSFLINFKVGYNF